MVCLVLAPVCAIGQGFYGTESLTVPEMTGPTTLDGVLDGNDSWNRAFSPMWMSDCFDDEGTPGDASDISAQFSMGTYEGDLYIAVVVTDDIDNTNGTTWQRDGLEVHVNFENVLVNMSQGSGADTAENRKINFLENGAAQIRVIGGANSGITPWPAGYPDADCQAVLDFARGRSGTTTTYEVVIKVSDMADVSITGPFGFGIAVNDVDETDGSRIAAVAWWGGPQQAQGSYNAVIVTSSSTIRPWQYTMNHASPTDLSYPECTAFLTIPGLASNPNPADEATDVPRDVVLSWTPGIYAPPVNGHRVYFSENFNEVNDGVGGITQDANSYDPPGRLDFGKAYYWRVDEVNGPPDFTIFKGGVWSFTVEPIAYPISTENIIATASSSDSSSVGPENTINGSGLDADDLHSVENHNMWLSSMTGAQPTWIQYEFDRIHKLHQMWVWNHNTAFEFMLGFGLKDVSIEYSTDGADWKTLGGVPEFAQAPGADGYAHNTTVDFGGTTAKYVRLTVNSNWSGIFAQYGLSEVRFFYIPVWAREPYPDSGATDVDVDVALGWRTGREAAEHDVCLSSDEQVVIDGSAPVTTVTDTSHGPLALDLGTTYYWRVDEVNDAETPTTWQGDIWNLTTPDFLVVEDFEAYDDYEPNRVFDTWTDGWGVPTNGSTVGYPDPIFVLGEHFVETMIVHGGNQSMPLSYDNTAGVTYSEAELALSPPQDWTRHGIKALTLYFHGAPDNGGQLYVKINNTKISDNTDLSIPKWNQMNIDLTGLTVDNVTSITVGVDGAGVSGVLLVDNIRLYADAPAIPESIWIEAETGVITGTKYEVTTMDGASGGQALSPWTAGSLSDASDNKASYTVQSIGGTYTL